MYELIEWKQNIRLFKDFVFYVIIVSLWHVYQYSILKLSKYTGVLDFLRNDAPKCL